VGWTWCPPQEGPPSAFRVLLPHDRSFAVAGPRLWYSLPVELRHLTISLER